MSSQDEGASEPGPKSPKIDAGSEVDSKILVKWEGAANPPVVSRQKSGGEGRMGDVESDVFVCRAGAPWWPIPSVNVPVSPKPPSA